MFHCAFSRSICIEPGADKPTEILGDKQDAIMSDISVIEASCIDENVTKPHVENNSESHGDAQINSTPYISNAYVAITQDHPLEQALLGMCYLHNHTHLLIMSPE